MDWATKVTFYIEKEKNLTSSSCRIVIIIRCTSVFVEEAPAKLRIRGMSDQNLISHCIFKTSRRQVTDENKENHHYRMLSRCFAIIKFVICHNEYFSKDNECFTNPIQLSG